MDSGEKRLNELGYKQELRREMVSILYVVILTLFHVSVSLLANSFLSPDLVPDTVHMLLNCDSFRSEHAAVWPQPALCRTCQLGMGVGCGFFLHLVHRNCHGRDLLLFPRMFFISYQFLDL